MLDEIMRHDHIGYKRRINNDKNAQYFTNVKINVITVHMCILPYISLIFFVYVLYSTT